jgi:predicted ArsR family transcriptional regulator
MLQKKLRDLFLFVNYRFSTNEREAGRPTSMYFEDAHGNQGRWRRGHRDGPLLVYQGKSLRLFVNPRQVGQFRDDTALRIYRDIRDGIGNYPNYSVLPKTQWHVVELVPPTFFVGHKSSGRVMLDDTTAGGAAFGELQNYDGNISDWTLAQN